MVIARRGDLRSENRDVHEDAVEEYGYGGISHRCETRGSRCPMATPGARCPTKTKFVNGSFRASGTGRRHRVPGTAPIYVALKD